MQPRIYTYKITFEEVSYYYYGVHKEKYFNEDYWGSPVTNKWCWELYTPKKQILEFFDNNADGWLEAQEIENRLIKSFLNDKLCLNENYGGILSLDVLKKTGKKAYKQSTGVHARTKEQMIIDGKKGGKSGGKKGGKKTYEQRKGIHALTKEQLSEQGKKTNSQKWQCLITGYICNAGALSMHQKARGIDTSKRIRIS
jgi:hypothetical protein